MAKTDKTSLAPESENTALWNELRTTPQEYTKQFQRAGGFSGKSIDPVYRIRRLTERFGPCGMGWGFVQEDQWSDGGTGVYCVYIRGYLWYRLNGKRYKTCSHTGGTDASRTPDEAYKMAETDALGKCCVDIGLAVDVYMGEHDGDKYQERQDKPRNGYQPDQAGRRPAGSNPSNAPAAKGKQPAMPIVEAEVHRILDDIKNVKDEVAAHALSKRMFGRLLVSVTLAEGLRANIAERIIGKRCELASENMVGNLEETINAFIKQGWIGSANAKKNLEIVKRRLGIAPEPETGKLPLE